MMIVSISFLLFFFQGFFVSLFYCFLNSEVRTTLRHRFNTWRDERNIRIGQSRQSRRYEYDWILSNLFFSRVVVLFYFILCGKKNCLRVIAPWKRRDLACLFFLLRWCKRRKKMWEFPWSNWMMCARKFVDYFFKKKQSNCISSREFCDAQSERFAKAMHFWLALTKMNQPNLSNR